MRLCQRLPVFLYVFVLLFGLAAAPALAAASSLDNAKAYLRAQQSASGSWTGPWGDWAAIALAAAGEDLDADQWLKDGTGHLDAVREAVYGWDVATTPTTTVARTLLAVATAKKAGADVDPRNFDGKDLVELLLSRQDQVSGHFGNLQYQGGWGPVNEATFVNAHVWSILALSAAGVGIPHSEQAWQWLLACQNSDGGWEYDTNWDGSDPDMTAAALRALAALGAEADDPDVREGLDYLHGKLDASGGVETVVDWTYGTEGVSTVTTAEAVMALCDLKINPAEGEWQASSGNPVSCLLQTQLADGSFTAQPGLNGGDFLATCKALQALAMVQQVFPGVLPEDGGNQNGGGGGLPSPQTITVTAGVRGLDGATMYAPRAVELAPGKQTPLGALEALGAHVTTGFGGGYVVAIDGLAEKQYGQASGWIYLVNGSAPPAACNAYRLRDGDDVLWRYVRSLAGTGDFLPNRLPVEPTLSPTLAGGIAAAEKALSAAKDGGPATTVLPSAPPDAAAAAELARALAANRVGLAQEVNPETETLVADELLEAGLKIPAGALERTVTISVREQKREEEGLPAPVGKTFASGVYDFGPDGQAFRKAATVYLRCLPSEGRAAADLTLAWFDPQSDLWRPLAAVYDPATGLLAGRITHFTRFAALTPAGPSPAFTDIDAGGKAWYAGAVKDLAARGVIGADEGPAFRPGDPVTRAVFTGWLARGLELLPGPAPSFTDLGVDAAYRAEIGAAARRGLVRGLPGGLFGPEKPLTRQELAAILVRAAHRAGQPEQLPPGRAEAVLGRYTDADQVAGWARTAVAAAVNEGLLVGTPDKHLNPRGPVTRAEAAAFVQRLVERERAVRDAA